MFYQQPDRTQFSSEPEIVQSHETEGKHLKKRIYKKDQKIKEDTIKCTNLQIQPSPFVETIHKENHKLKMEILRLTEESLKPNQKITSLENVEWEASILHNEKL